MTPYGCNNLMDIRYDFQAGEQSSILCLWIFFQTKLSLAFCLVGTIAPTIAGLKWFDVRLVSVKIQAVNSAALK